MGGKGVRVEGGLGAGYATVGAMLIISGFEI